MISFADRKLGIISVVVGTTIAHPTLSISIRTAADSNKTEVAIKTEGFQKGFGGADRVTKKFFRRLTDEMKKTRTGAAMPSGIATDGA